MRYIIFFIPFLIIGLAADSAFAQDVRYRVEVIVLTHLDHGETPREAATPSDYGDAIDFLGRGIRYARFLVHPDAIHVENNCNARDLLMIYDHLLKHYPKLLILDLQSKDVHNGASFLQWWSKPL